MNKGLPAGQRLPWTEDRFRDAVEFDTISGCWLWRGSMNSRGYGLIRFEGRTMIAPRLAYQVCRGAIHDRLFVCHRCDVPACVNPSHLFLGTHADNMRDMTAKGRRVSKLKPKDVLAVRGSLRAGQTTRQIATAFGVSQATICSIRDGSRWGELPGRDPYAKPPHIKLTAEDVLAIYDLARSGMTRRKIAERFSVSAPTVTNIVNGKERVDLYQANLSTNGRG